MANPEPPSDELLIHDGRITVLKKTCRKKPGIRKAGKRNGLRFI